MLFEWFKKRYAERLDDYYFERTIRDVSFGFNEKHIDYLKQMMHDNTFYEILDVIEGSVVRTGLAAQTVDGIKTRHQWLLCLDFFRKELDKRKPKPQPTVNPMTGLSFVKEREYQQDADIKKEAEISWVKNA